MTALKMTVDEALALADQWCAGLTMTADSKGWGAILLVLAEEVRLLREREAGLLEQHSRDSAELRRVLEAVYDLLPGSYYMDPPDGGDVPLLEQLRRMAEDAKLWRTHKAMEATNAG